MNQVFCFHYFYPDYDHRMVAIQLAFCVNMHVDSGFTLVPKE